MKEQVNTANLDNNLALLSPRQVMEHCHKSSALAVQTIGRNRDAIKQIVSGDDSRLLVVVGPCSIHNVEEAIDYAHCYRSQTGTRDYQHKSVYLD